MSMGGYDVKLASRGCIPASYYCPYCKKLLKNAVQTSDGDRLCDVCFEEISRFTYLNTISDTDMNLTAVIISVMYKMKFQCCSQK